MRKCGVVLRPASQLCSPKREDVCPGWGPTYTGVGCVLTLRRQPPSMCVLGGGPMVIYIPVVQ